MIGLKWFSCCLCECERDLQKYEAVSGGGVSARPLHHSVWDDFPSITHRGCRCDGTSGGTARRWMAKQSADLCSVFLFWIFVCSIVSLFRIMFILFICFLGLIVKSYFIPWGLVRLIHVMTGFTLGKKNTEMLNSSLFQIKSLASLMLAINYQFRLFLAVTSNNVQGGLGRWCCLGLGRTVIRGLNNRWKPETFRN